MPNRRKAALGFALCFLSYSSSCSNSSIPAKADHPHTPAENVLRFAGDVMLTRGVGRAIAAAGDHSLPFRQIGPVLQSADIAFVNLESPFSDKGKRTRDGLIFNADPANIAGLILAGVDVASTANNHSRDAGAHGVEFTYKWLGAHGIQPVGSGASAVEVHRGVIVERHGVRFGFLAYTYDQQNGNWHDIDGRVADIDIGAMRRDVADLALRCNVVIVSMHNGIEYQEHPNQSQRSFAHTAIDAGATLVIGHHPHVVQPFEYYRNGLIFYSLGNFVFDQFQRQKTQRGEIAEVRFLGSYIESARVLPVQIAHNGPVLITDSAPLGHKKPFAQAGDQQKAAPQQ